MPMRRKNIALFTVQPEAAHEIRIIQGIAAQCRKYHYNFMVFAPMTHLEFKRETYIKAEADIYRLPNFDLIDGLILDSVNLVSGEGVQVIKNLTERLKAYPDLPVVSLETPIGHYPLIKNKNDAALREMCRHAIEVHGKRKLCILTGFQDNEVAQSRLNVCLDEIERHGITVDDEHIVYGDFWYTSGDALAQKLISGEITMPETVLCTSTHMALGLIYRLQKGGIRVPDDLIVIGFDTTDEGRCNDIVLSAYDAADASSAGEAVDYIRRIIDPCEEILPYESNIKKMFYPGMSCGCQPDLAYAMKAFRNVSYLVAHNSAADENLENVDFGRLMESYCLEEFTASNSPEDCIKRMGETLFLLHPFKNYYLCLRKDWTENREALTLGYPDEMNVVLSAQENLDGTRSVDITTHAFNTCGMIPGLLDSSEEPSIFYFSPIHFDEITLGYSVLRRSFEDCPNLTLVYRTWLRFVNNALEMTRAKKQLLSLSVRDSMTGLYNRRGMELQLKDMLSNAREGDHLFVAEIDMDGLKKINDTHGHAEGDFGIMTIAKAVAQSTLQNEISVRAGGDEFYIIGVGNYQEDAFTSRKNRFLETLDKLCENLDKPYELTASFGCSTECITADLNIDSVISLADEEMYKAKILAKKQRGAL